MLPQEFEKQYMEQFTDQQRQAVLATEGAVLLLAVPGSGKTTVLVTRLGYMLLCCGISSDKVLTLTYTKAAAAEMKQRFENRFGKLIGTPVEFRTINGISAKIVAFYSQNVSRKRGFDLLEDEGTLNRIVRECYSRVSDEYPDDATIKDIRSLIAYVKNMMLSDQEIAELETDIEEFKTIYDAYCAELRSRSVMDYDDQMVYAHTILKSYPKILEYYQNMYPYICVDEAQDTSKIQHAIIQLLAQRTGNLFMVGDEDQSIYGFRAAYPRALMEFEKNFPGARVLLMEENFRSTGEIVRVANSFVEKNLDRHPKIIRATREQGTGIKSVRAINREAQYLYLFAASEAVDRETAILFRNNDSALPLIDYYDRHGIAFQCRKIDKAVFNNRIIIDISDIIHFAHNQNDTERFMRIYYKFGAMISKTMAKAACDRSMKSGKSIPEELLKDPKLHGSARDTVMDLISNLPELTKDSGEMAIQRIWMGLRYCDFVRDHHYDQGKYDILLMIAKNTDSAMGFLQRLEELKEISAAHEWEKGAKIVLSTIHSSKGLEFDRVYLLDTYDGILPKKGPRELEDSDEMEAFEEERRLYYVGMTRAKNELYLINCEKQASFNEEILRVMPKIIRDDSLFAPLTGNLCGRVYFDSTLGAGRVFAQEGDSLLIQYTNRQIQLKTIMELWQSREVRYQSPETVQDSRQKVDQNVVSDPSELRVGMTVYHTTLKSLGKVLSIDGNRIKIMMDPGCDVKTFMIDQLLKTGKLRMEK